MNEQKFILLSFLGNNDYEEENTYIFKDFLPFKKDKIDAKCSFEAINKNLDLEKLILFLTKEAKEKFDEFCESSENIEIVSIKESESFNELLKKFLKKLREISGENKTIIIDLTHAYRHFSILKFLSSLIANSLLEDIQLYIVYAKEIKENEYELLELNEYIDYYELFEAIEYFISDLYVPEIFYKKLTIYSNKISREKEIEKIFKDLYKIGKAIRENNLKIDNKDIWDLVDEILNKIEELEKQISFLKEVFKYENGKKFKEILKRLKDLRYKEEYEQLLELAEITFEKKLLLNSAIYLMEGMSEFIYWKFKDKAILRKDSQFKTPEEYKDSFEFGGKYRTLNCLKNIAIYELIF